MSAATSAIPIDQRHGYFVALALAAATIIFAGTLVARDANGRAVPASDTAGLRVVGRAAETVDNSAGAAGALTIQVEPGIFKYGNSATQALTIASIGKLAVVEDDNTVASTSTNKVSAGRIVDIESSGVWVDTRYAFFGLKTLVVATSADGVAAAAADLAALKAEAEKIGDDVRALLTALNG